MRGCLEIFLANQGFVIFASSVFIWSNGIEIGIIVQSVSYNFCLQLANRVGSGSLRNFYTYTASTSCFFRREKIKLDIVTRKGAKSTKCSTVLQPRRRASRSFSCFSMKLIQFGMLTRQSFIVFFANYVISLVFCRHFEKLFTSSFS